MAQCYIPLQGSPSESYVKQNLDFARKVCSNEINSLEPFLFTLSLHSHWVCCNKRVGLALTPLFTLILSFVQILLCLYFSNLFSLFSCLCGTLKYLGSSLSTDATIGAEISCRLFKAGTAFGKLESRLWKRREISVYKAVVLPIILYGYKSWTPLKRNIHKLDRFHMRSLC